MPERHPGKPLELKIGDLERLSKERDLQGIIAYAVLSDGTVQCVTYGKTRRKCEALGWVGQGWMDQILTAVPFQTVFGWGNGGRPKPLTQKEMGQIEPETLSMLKTRDLL